MGALLPLLLGPGGEHGKGHCCRCLQMFADVLLAPVVELVTSEPQASAQPGKKTDAGSVPRLVPWGLQWGVPTGDTCPG